MARARARGRTKPRVRWTAKQAEAHLKRWRRSGKSLRSYCASAGVRYERVRRWRIRLGEDRPLRLRQVRIVEAPMREPLRSSALELAVGADVVLRVHGEFDPERIAALARGLRA